MHRRDALAVLLASLAASRAAWAQGKVYRIAWLSGTAVVPGPMYDVFVAAMRDLGWVEGRNYSVDNLLYEGHSERLAVIAADAVARKFDLIICAGTPPTVAAKKATSTIPIVFYFLGDPIGSGVVASFAHPGGNVTGLGGLGPGIYTKMLELLKEAAPKATRVAMLVNSTFSLHAGFFADAEAAARLMRLTLRPVEVRSPDDMDSAFATVKREKPDALLILGQPFLVGQGPRVAKFAIEQRLPTMVPFEGVVNDGILMSYGSRLIDDIRRIPHYVDRILKGTPPGELPVEQPTRFYLTVNLKTAKAIGLMLPASLLSRADVVIE
jgi:putative ABC transport system substrate-binding protein